MVQGGGNGRETPAARALQKQGDALTSLQRQFGILETQLASYREAQNSMVQVCRTRMAQVCRTRMARSSCELPGNGVRV